MRIVYKTVGGRRVVVTCSNWHDASVWLRRHCVVVSIANDARLVARAVGAVVVDLAACAMGGEVARADSQLEQRRLQLEKRGRA